MKKSRELGFEMDCGSSLEELFPGKSVFEDNAAFKNVIDHWNNAPMNEEKLSMVCNCIFPSCRAI